MPDKRFLMIRQQRSITVPSKLFWSNDISVPVDTEKLGANRTVNPCLKSLFK